MRQRFVRAAIAAIEIEPDEAVRDRAIGYLRKVLAQPEIRLALSPPPDAAEAPIVWHERTFCAVLSDGGVPVLRNGAFDRVILHGSEGSHTGAMIQDYKTDVVTVEDIQDKVDHYAPQLAAYRTALAKMTGLAEENIRAVETAEEVARRSKKKLKDQQEKSITALE